MRQQLSIPQKGFETSAPEEESTKRAVNPPVLEQAAVFVLSFAILAAAAAWLTFYYRLYEGDALSRTYAAAVVLYGSPPGLAKLGLIWSPLTSLLQIPLAMYSPLITAGLAGRVVSALAGAAGLVLMDRILTRHVPNAKIRLLMLVVYQANVLVLYYSINGMSEMLLIALALGCWDQFQRLCDELPHSNGATHVALMGTAAGAAFLTRYEGLWLGLVVYISLLIALLTKGRRKLGLVQRGRGRQRLTMPDGTVVIEGYSLAYLTPFVYAIFLWLLFNWMIMGDPFNFLFGKGSNIQQSSVLLRSSEILAAARGDVLLSSAYAMRQLMSVFPAFYLAAALLLLVVALRRDAFGAILVNVVASFPISQLLLTFLGQSFGSMRFYIYVIPFSVIGLAYVFRHLKTGSRVRAVVVQWALVVLVLASSALTLHGVAAPDAAREGEMLFVQAVMRNEPADNLAREKEIAEYLARIPLDQKILADDQQADYIILFTQ
mgnify:CR=1 FL=1